MISYQLQWPGTAKKYQKFYQLMVFELLAINSYRFMWVRFTTRRPYCFRLPL